jgi:hypothetical protein
MVPGKKAQKNPKPEAKKNPKSILHPLKSPHINPLIRGITRNVRKKGFQPTYLSI